MERLNKNINVLCICTFSMNIPLPHASIKIYDTLQQHSSHT